MSIELINAIAAIVTFALLLLTALAGIVQLRHLRAGNELAAILAIERDFREPAIVAALVFAAHDLPARLEDPAYRRELEQPGYVDPAAHPEMALCNWFERTGSLVRAGFVSEELFLDSFGRLVGYYWRVLGPAVAVLRRRRGPGQYAGFEYLAYRAAARLNAPASPRASRLGLPVIDPWRDEDAERERPPSPVG